MNVYQQNQESACGTIQIISSNALYNKARYGLMELSMSLCPEVMRMMFEEEEQYTGPKGKHNTKERIGYRRGTDKTTDPLNKAIIAKLLSGVSTRKYTQTLNG